MAAATGPGWGCGKMTQGDIRTQGNTTCGATLVLDVAVGSHKGKNSLP